MLKLPVTAELEPISISSFLAMNADKTTIGNGKCSECQDHCGKLRVCTDCAIQQNLLKISENGDLELPNGNSEEELMEFQILRIRSTALCANCAIDGEKHRGHNLVFLTSIHTLVNASAFLDGLSTFSISFHKIERELDQYKHMKTVLMMLSCNCEIIKLTEAFSEYIERTSFMDKDFGELIKYFLDFLYRILWISEALVEQKLNDALENMKRENSTEEKLEWQKTIEKLKSFREFYSSRNSKIDLNTSVTPFREIIRKVFLGDDLETDSRSDISYFQEVFCVMRNIISDGSRICSLPPNLDLRLGADFMELLERNERETMLLEEKKQQQFQELELD